MSLNVKCPKCGSTQVQLSSVSSKHGCLWLVLFGWAYLLWLMIKWTIGIMVFLFVDWWMEIVQLSQNKGYVWKCKGWFSMERKFYYCHSCGHNFRG